MRNLVVCHPGVGTEPGFWDRAMGGAIGKGLDDNIKSAYHWLCRNSQSQDRMYLFGFSRGAYTARGLGWMTARCGLLKLDKLSPDEVWQRIDHVFQRGYRDRRETPDDWKKKQWAMHSLNGSYEIPIEMIGVWDTVGALGIPDDLALLDLLDACDEHSFNVLTSISNRTIFATVRYIQVREL